MVVWLGRVGYGVVFLLALVGLQSVIGRFFLTAQYLADPASVTTEGPELLQEFQARYFAHPYLTLAHIVPGLLFMILGPMQFWPAVRNRWIAFHRWSGRVWMLASLAAVVSAFFFVGRLPVFGNFSSSVAVVVGGTLFLICLVQGYRAIRHRDITAHREWMIRTFAIGLGISTFRVLIPLLMIPPLNASFPEAWDTVTWLGFTLNALAAEAWINLTRRTPRAGQPNQRISRPERAATATAP